MKRTQNTMSPANLAHFARLYRSFRALRRFNRRADRMDYLNTQRPDGEKLVTLAPRIDNALVLFGSRPVVAAPVDDTPARTGHNVKVTKARRNAAARKAEVKHFKEKRKARIAFWDNHNDKSAPDYCGINSHDGQAQAYTAPERQYHDSISEVIENLVLNGVSADSAVNAAFNAEDKYSQWRDNFMTTAYTEKAPKNSTFRKFSSKIVRLPYDVQKDLFEQFQKGADKYEIADRLGLFGNRCAKYLLRHCPEMYFATIAGEKPHDIADMSQDGALALWAFETGYTLSGYGKNDLPALVAAPVDGWTMILEPYGVRLKWLEENARKAFYVSVVNGVNHARGGRMSTKTKDGKRTFRFWKMVSLSDFANLADDTDNDTPDSNKFFQYAEKALVYETVNDLYGIYGDSLTMSVLDLHAAFVRGLSIDEKYIFMGLLEHGQNVHALARFSGLSDYKAKKTLAVVLEKWFAYAPEYKPATMPASPAPVDFKHVRKTDTKAGKAGTVANVVPAENACLFWNCGQSNAPAPVPLTVSVKSPAPVGLKAYAIAR